MTKGTPKKRQKMNYVCEFAQKLNMEKDNYPPLLWNDLLLFAGKQTNEWSWEGFLNRFSSAFLKSLSRPTLHVFGFSGHSFPRDLSLDGTKKSLPNRFRSHDDRGKKILFFWERKLTSSRRQNGAQFPKALLTNGEIFQCVNLMVGRLDSIDERFRSRKSIEEKRKPNWPNQTVGVSVNDHRSS